MVHSVKTTHHKLLVTFSFEYLLFNYANTVSSLADFTLVNN